jgi:hypothetical protein
MASVSETGQSVPAEIIMLILRSVHALMACPWPVGLSIHKFAVKTQRG